METNRRALPTGPRRSSRGDARTQHARRKHERNSNKRCTRISATPYHMPEVLLRGRGQWRAYLRVCLCCRQATQYRCRAYVHQSI